MYADVMERQGRRAAWSSGLDTRKMREMHFVQQLQGPGWTLEKWNDMHPVC